MAATVCFTDEFEASLRPKASNVSNMGLKGVENMRINLIPACVAAGLLAACGGGGGGGGTVDTLPPSTAAQVTLSGLAAKGPVAGADVAVFAVGSDGKTTASALATGTTGANGSYSLSFNATQGQPYVVQIKANPHISAK